MTMVDAYLEVGGVIILVALSICVVYLSLRLRSVNAQKHLHRRSSILADKMADAVRGLGEQPSPGPPPARRRRQYPQLGRLHRGNSLPSNPRGRPAYFVPREDSPLLGLEPILLDEEKEETTSWSPSARVAQASDVDKTHMMSRTQRGRVDEVNDSQSRMTAVSEEPTTMSATDEALLGTFMEVMSEGLAIKIHRISSHARKAVMWLKDRDTLVWSTKRTLGAKKWEKLQLSGGTKVQAGKGSESYDNADDALFLLLVLDSGPLGLEASSELERDALVQGFRMLIEDIKTHEKLDSV